MCEEGIKGEVGFENNHDLTRTVRDYNLGFILEIFFTNLLFLTVQYFSEH